MMLENGRGAEIIEAVRNNTYPHNGWDRGHKMSKEQIVGLVAALEIFVKEGDKQYDKQMETAKNMVNGLKDIPDINVMIIPNDETFHEHPVMPHVPRVLVEWDFKKVGLKA